MTTLFLDNLDEHRALFATLDSLEPAVSAAAEMLAACLREGGKLMFCGNGGSAADSQHLAAELTGRFIHERRPLAALALSTDTSALTCIANDYAFDQVFARQLQALGRPGDCLVAISTSGNSANVIAAVEVARGLGIGTIGLLGRDGGRLRELCSQAVVVPSAVTARIQEAHILIGHSWCGLIEQALGLARARRERLGAPAQFPARAAFHARRRSVALTPFLVNSCLQMAPKRAACARIIASMHCGASRPGMDPQPNRPAADGIPSPASFCSGPCAGLAWLCLASSTHAFDAPSSRPLSSSGSPGAVGRAERLRWRRPG